jgi:site-specific DNA-cytosine methylase
MPGHVAIAGFSCKSLSKANTSYMKGNNKVVLADSSGSSGETFTGTMAIAERMEPPIYILENVEDLMLVSSDNRQALMEAHRT